MARDAATAPVFACARYLARELSAADVPRLQALFDANPDYFLAVDGRPPDADQAQRDFDELPPAHLGFTRRWFAGLFERSGRLIGVADVVSDLGVADVVSDLGAAEVWHIALLMVETPLHGSGAASEILAALEAWAGGAGAKWLRLGVVAGNARAERFWSRHGFRELRTREGVGTGGRVQSLRVLAKPLAGAGIAEYLQRVPRDRPDSLLP